MELRQLVYALKIAEERNISRAAEKLHLAQPSLSQQLAKLEQELGVTLFERTTASVELTHAGKQFMSGAMQIIDRVEQLKKEMEDVAELRKGQLTIGSMPMTGAYWLPKVLPLFKNKYPGIEVMLIEETSADLEAATSRGQTDLSLLSLPLQDAFIDWVPMIEEEIGIAFPMHHPKSNQTMVILNELREEPFILLKNGQGLRNMALERCIEEGFEPKIVFESSNIETVKAMVAAGMGIAFVPKFLSREKEVASQTKFISLNPRMHRTLVLAYRKNRYLTKAAQAFIETTKQGLNQ